jgi:hypothetical protein
MVIACIALLVALAGTGVAAVSVALPRGSVGTPQLKNNAVTSKKVLNGSLVKGDFRAGSLPAGAAGPAGPAGAAGPAGPAGPAGSVTKLTAVVNSSGSLARSQGTTSAGHLAVGQYEVIFTQDVTNCTYLATIGSPVAGAAPVGQIAVAPRTGSVNGVFVATRDSAGAFDDLAFHLAVIC